MANYNPTIDRYPGISPPGDVVIDFNQTLAGIYLIAAARTGHFIQLIHAELYIAGAQELIFSSASDPIVGATFEFGGAFNFVAGVLYLHNIRSRLGETLRVELTQNIKVRGPISARYIAR